MTINLYFGDNSNNIANQALSADPQAFLIDRSNYAKFLNSPPVDNVTVYTSLSDLPKISNNKFVIYQLLDLADKIFYGLSDFQIDEKSQIFIKFMFLSMQQQKNNVYNLDLSKYSSDVYTGLEDNRKSENHQLWISGCSMSHGVGVDINQRYGQLIANQINYPVSFLTKGSSSIPWAVDQIVRSDIRAGDIVILGLTDEVRFPYWRTNKEVFHIIPSIHERQNQNHKFSFTNISRVIADRLITDDNVFYQSIIRIYQLINFCDKVGAKLLILGILSSGELALHLHNVDNFIHYTNFKSPFQYIDIGTDNLHPGPLQHQLYADFCQTALKKLNYI